MALLRDRNMNRKKKKRQPKKKKHLSTRMVGASKVKKEGPGKRHVQKHTWKEKQHRTEGQA